MIIKKNLKKLFTVSALAAAVSFSLNAEEINNSPTNEANQAVDKSKLEVIMVTAQKRVENVQKVPVAISVVDQEKLNAYTSSGDDIRFLSARVPSLVVESSLGRTYPRFFIRGFGNTDFRSNASQPVELVMDGVIQSNPNLKGFPAFDLERIEVLKGPQGTLFGRNTPAGIIKLDSIKPAHDFDGYAKLNYGSYGQLNLEGAVGGSLSDTLAGRVSLTNQTRDDYIDNDFTGENDVLGGYDDFAGRAQLLWTPNDDLSVLFNIHARDLDGTAQVFYANVIAEGSQGLKPDFDRETVYHDGQNVQELEQSGGSIRVDYDLGSVTVTSITAVESLDLFTRGDVDGGYGCGFCNTENGPGFIPFSVETAGHNDVEQFTQELRVASNGWDFINFQAGIFYFDEELFSNEFEYDSVFDVGAITKTYDISQDNTTLGIFGSLNIQATDKLNVIAGVRYSKDEKDFYVEGTSPISERISDSTDASKVSWDLTASYQLNDDILLYSKVAKGFRAPSIHGNTGGITTAHEEELISIEGGIKSTLLDDSMRLNAAIFRYEVDGQQLTAVGGKENKTSLLNADTTVGQGVEVDVEYLITENLVVSAGMSYNDTEIQHDGLGIEHCGVPNCTVLDPIIKPGVAGVDGNRLPQAPEWISSFTARYSIPLESGEIYMFTDWAYKSETNLFLYESVEFTAESSLEGGFRIGFISESSYEIALYGRNITDEEVVTGALDFDNFTAIVNEPRTFGIEFKKDFF